MSTSLSKIGDALFPEIRRTRKYSGNRKEADDDWTYGCRTVENARERDTFETFGKKTILNRFSDVSHATAPPSPKWPVRKIPMQNPKLFDHLTSSEENNYHLHYKRSVWEKPLKNQTSFFPFFVMPVAVFFEIYRSKSSRFRTWQDLYKRNLIRVYDPEFDKSRNVIFVSHQWTCWDHPDHEGKKLRVLYGVLKKLVKGEIGVKSSWFRLLSQNSRATNRNECKDMFENALLWMDYQSIPQHCETRDLVTKAIASIPSYINKSDVVLALTPPCPQSCKKGHVTNNFHMIMSRGWIRFEFFCTLFSPGQADVMRVNGPSLVSWMSNLRLSFLGIGDGKFSCCERSGGRAHACDKYVLYKVVKSIINACIYRHMYGHSRSIDRARVHISTRSHWLVGLKKPNDEINEDVNARSATLDEFKRLLMWRDGIDDVAATKSGWTLLKFAILANNRDIVKHLCVERSRRSASVDDPIRSPYGRFGFVQGLTNLHCAAMNMNSDAKIVSYLLEAGAHRFARATSLKLTPFALMISRGNSSCMRYYLKTFPHDIHEQHEVFHTKLLPLVLTMAHTNTIDAFEAICETGLDMDVVSRNGQNIFHSVVKNPGPERLALFEHVAKRYANKYGVDALRKALNVCPEQRSKVFKSRCVVVLSRILTRTNLHKRSKYENIVRLIVQSENATPMAIAALSGQIDLVQSMMAFGGDPYIRRWDGSTVFDILRETPGSSKADVLRLESHYAKMRETQAKSQLFFKTCHICGQTLVPKAIAGVSLLRVFHVAFDSNTKGRPIDVSPSSLARLVCMYL